MKHLSLLNNNPIGVFDSGLGGLTVLKALKEKLPKESFIYFGDTAHVPYGTKSAESVINYSEKITTFLVKHNVKMVVIACNTASSVAAQHLRSKFNIPIFSVVSPCVDSAIQISKNKNIGVIGTQSTIASNSYVNAFKKKASAFNIYQKACPLFVPLIEEGWANHKIAFDISTEYLNSFKPLTIDTLVLGCTHYPIMKETIQSIIGEDVHLISSDDAVANTVHQNLQYQQIMADENNTPAESFYVSDFPQKFNEIGSQFLGRPLTNLQHIQL